MTVRTLVLLRHAKAEKPGDHPDVERRLTKRGQADAAAAGTWLAAESLVPGLVLCSPATRTRQTWHSAAIAIAEADPSVQAPEVRYERDLYAGGRSEVVDLLRGVPDAVSTVLVVGHNPTMSELSALLRADGDGTVEEIRTCGLVVHRAEGPWSGTEPGSMEVAARHTARG